MIRNLKALGLALVAVFAMSALAASAAQAVEATFSWPETTKHLTATADPTAPAQNFTITTGKFGFECNVVTGEQAVTGTGAASIGSTNLTFSHTEKPADNCKGPLNSNAPVKMNGCTFTFKAGTTLKEAPTGESEGTADVVCPPEKEITIEAVGCITHVPAQTGLGPVFYRTVKTGAKEEVTIEAKVAAGIGAHNKAITSTHTGFTCGTGTSIDGAYTGKATIKGFEANKTTQSDITVT